MNRKNIKAIIIGLCLLMTASVTACNKTKESNTPTPAVTTKEVAKPDVLEITKTLFIGDASDYPELKEEFAKEYEKKFGIKLKVNAIPRNTYMEKINLMLTSGEIKGILSFFGPSDVLKAIEDGTIEPLDEYLKDNKVWQSLPEEMKNLYKYEGKTYGIPQGYNGQVFTRWVRKDWLDNLGMKAPQTIDDLYNMAKAFVEQDPDKNGKQDTGGLTAAGTWNLQDVFQAFDARLDNTGSYGFVWDPKDGAWVDSMLKPGMVDALKYLNNMYKNGYLDKEVFTNKGSNMREKIYSGKFGSTFYWITQGVSVAQAEINKTNPNGKIEEVIAITGKRTTDVNVAVMTGAPYVLVKGTKNPKEVVNAFINTFYGDEAGYLMGKLGVDGKMFKKEGNTYLWLKNPQGSPFGQPGIVTDMPKYPADKYPVVVDGTAAEKAASLDLVNMKNKMTNDAMSKKLVYICPGNYDAVVSKTYTERKADFAKIHDEAITKAIMGQLSPEEALANYRKQMKALGGDKVLQEANKTIGKEAKQTY
jgi:putative aldouronate transport system substrate-binding protein